MAAQVLLFALALPLGLAGLWAVPSLRGTVGQLVPWAPLPALGLALFAPGATASLDGLLLGTRLGLTDTTRVFLLFTALLWLAAGLYARGYLRDDPRRPRFEFFWLLTLSGNLGLILALDVVSFYALFALMTFAGYGLVVHTATAEARHAGRVYLIMAVLGEGLLLAGLILASSRTATPMLPLLAELPAAIADAPQRDWILGLLWMGFGVKAGLPLLHLWLPLAHPVAPVPASAVLSGAMIKAGLLGWLHTFPLGLVSLPGWGTAVIGMGLLAAYGAVFLGLHQHRPKTVLAYSSISQMGLISVGLGAGLVVPELWPLLGPAVVLYALHHALAKGALFLGVGIARHPGRLPRALLWVLLALPALSVVGLMTSGAIAKLALKAALGADAPVPEWWSLLPPALAFAAVASTLIVARYLWLLRTEDRGDQAPATMFIGWGLSLLGGLTVIFLPLLWGLADAPSLRLYEALALAWPVLAGVALAAFAARWLRPWPIPAGDLLALLPPLTTALAGLRRAIGRGTGRGIGRGGEAFAAWWSAQRPRARRLAKNALHPDQFWRREVVLVFALVLVLMLATALA